MGSNCCKGDAAGKPVARSNSSIYTRTRAGATLDGRFKTSVEAGGVRLTVSSAQTGDSGVYTLQASNAAGKDSTRVSLEVSPEEMPTGDDPPTFLRRLQDLTVKVGTRTRFLVEIVSSTDCKVTWYRNERRLLEAERIALVRDGNFWCADVATVSVDDAGRWTCTAENLGGRASCSAHLNVLVPKAYKRPEFVEELRAILTEQGTVSLECKVVGVPTPVLRWFKDSREIKAGDVFALTANADDPTSLGTYTCEAINCMGRAYSSSKVHVIGRSKEGSDRLTSGGMTPDPPPIFTKELEDQFVRICEPLTLSCHIVVPPWPRNVVWYNKEGKIEPSTKYHVLEDGVGGYMVEVSRAEWADEGEWKCVATSAGGRVGISTCSVTMDVPKNYRKPRFMENLQAILTEEGLVSFECKVVGFPTPVLSWFKDGQELKPGDVYQLTGTNSLGSYCCIARNCMGQASSSAELTVEDIQNQLNEEEKLQLFSKNQAPKFLQGLKSVEVKIDEPFRFTIKVAIPPDPTVLWYRDDQPIDESPRCHLGREDRGVFYLDIKHLELMDQTEWKCVAMNDFGHSVTSCFLKLIIPRHFKKPRFLENLQAILSDEGAVNLECKVIGVPQPVLKWYKDGEELKPGDIHRIISGQDGTCCLGTYTCEAQNCMGIAASSASLLGFEDTVKSKKKKAEEQALQRNLSLSTIHEERTSQMYDTPVADITLDDKGEISFSFDGKEVSVSLYETPDLTEEEALQIVEMYADQLSENVTEHNVIELPPLRFVKETSTSGNLLMEAIIIDVSPDYFASPEEDLRTEADIEDISIADENIHAQLSFDQEVGEDYIEKTMALLSDEKADMPSKISRRKSDSQKSGEDYFSLTKDLSISEEKRDDDTHILSESVSFASARSTGKQKSKPSQEDELGTQEFSDITKTVLLREERRSSLDMDNKVKCNPENRSERDSTKDINLQAVELPIDSLIIKTLNQDMIYISSLLFKVINDIQVMERDIILKSQLMSSAAIASKSLEIINSLITPLSEIHTIADTVRETINKSSEINTKLFTKLPYSLKELQKTLIMVEKCIDVGNDKTLIKNTCISIINNYEEDIRNVVTKIKNVTDADPSFIDKTIISEVQSLTREILNIIKISKSTVETKSIINQEIKIEEVSVDIQHLNDTQKAIYDLKIPLHSLLSIVENALKENTVSSMDINCGEVILINMSASIQDLQTALEHIEFLSVEESNSSLQKYNTNIIETVMGSVLKLRSSFENLSLEKNQRDATEKLQNVLQVIKVNLNEISSHISNIESTIGVFDVLHGDNKLEILQKMAHILISLENSLPILSSLTNVQSTLTTFHKNLTKALEHVIESNDRTKYLTLVRICDVVNRINVAVKSISSTTLLSLASVGNNFSIIEEILKNNSIEQTLNQDILKSINQYFIDIQNITIYIEDESIRIDSEHVHDISTDLCYNESKANKVIHQIEKVIAVINNVPSEEVISNLSAVVPVLQNICPVLEELKYNIASLKQITQENESQSSDITVSSLAETFGKPLQVLHENITVINQFILESVGEEKFKDEFTAVFAKPLHELYTTLQILQENIISQYDSFSSIYTSDKIATAVQTLQNFVLLVQEQPEIEPIEEMSTLEDISCIKTSADSISSDHLMLPLVEVTTVEQAPTFFRMVDQQPEVANVFQLLHNDIIEIQNLDILDALNTLSEVKEYADLKLASKTIVELQNKITGILSPLLMESLSSVSNLDMANSNITTVSETLLKLKNHLSIIDLNNIPSYENVLQIPSDKIHLIVKNISNLKVHLDQCLSAVDQTSYVVPELSKDIDNLCKVCEDLKSCITDPMQKEVKTKLSLGSIRDLENSIESFLRTMKISSNKNVEIIKDPCEKMYKEILKVQDEVVQYVSLPGDVYVEDDQLVAKINIIANYIGVLEQYNIIDISNIDMVDFIKPTYNITSETQSFIAMEDLVKSKVAVIHHLLQQTYTSDLARVDEFFTSCKSSFFIMLTLLCQQPTRKKIIRLLGEYFRLKMKICDFSNQRSILDLSPEVQLCLDNFFIQAEDNMEKIKTSMLKIYSALSTSLFKRPLEKIKDSIEYLPKYLKLDNMLDIHGLIQNFLIILNIAYPHLKNLENAVYNELQSGVLIDSYVEDRLITDSLENFITLLENEINTSTGRKILLTDIVKCFQNHQDFKHALGTSKKVIILKCLADCTDLLRKQILETEKEVDLLLEQKSLQTVLHKLVEPLKLINCEIKQLQNEYSCGLVQSVQSKTIEAYAQNIVQIKRAIQEHVDFKKNFFHENDISVAKAIIQEIQSIQETLSAVKHIKGFQLSDTEICLKEIEILLSNTLLIGKTSSEDKLSQSEIVSFLQHVEQYIEITENIEKISTVVNMQNIQEVKKISQELRDNIANSEINPDDALEKIISENQDNLVQCLQNSLDDIHKHGLDKSYDLISTNNSIQQHSIEIINQLQDDLNKITSISVPRIDTLVKCIDDDIEIKTTDSNIEEILHSIKNNIENISSEAIKLKEKNVIFLQDDIVKNIETNITSDKTELFFEGVNPNLVMDPDDNNTQINRPDLQTCTEKIKDTKLHSQDLENNKDLSQNIATNAKMYIEESKVEDFSTDILQREDNAVLVIHQIENTVLCISNIDVEETSSNINNIYPVLENICPVLEELKVNIASLHQFEQGTESHTSDMSDNSIEQTFGKPLRELEKNINVLNQLLLESVKDDVENVHIPEVLAKPLYELYSTYQTLQENVISQYESFSSLRDRINIAETTQILQSCVLLIEEHHLVEAADEMSTLEDVSCIKTTAESISSGVLPLAQETYITNEENIDEIITNNNEDNKIGANNLSKIRTDEGLVNIQELTENLIEIVEVKSDQNQIPLISEKEEILDKDTIDLKEQKDIIETDHHITTNQDLYLKNISGVEQDNSLSKQCEDKANQSQMNDITFDIKIPIDESKSTVEELVQEDDRKNLKFVIIDDESSCNLKDVVELVTENKIEKDKYSIEDIQSIEHDKKNIIQCGLTDLNETTTVEPEMIDSQNFKLSIEDTVQNVVEDQTHNVLENISSITPVTLEIIEEKHLKHEEVINKMESLLNDLQEYIKKYADINFTNNTEIIQNILDEFQMQIIKLKSVNLKETNETLDDLECSVRSVQLLVSEKSPPHHVVEASETLQLLINSLKDDLNTKHSDRSTEESDHNLLEKCVNDTETTLLLLNKVSEKKGDQEDTDKIITSLNSIKDTFKSIKQNFATDEENLIENGVDIIQTIDMIENQLFSIESDLDKIPNIDLITHDAIVTAIHSVFMNISNMRETISSIQKQYIYENYGRPSENLLNTIKHIYIFEKFDNRSNWKLLTKHLRIILNHFEDIKFYINLDKTARLPSDASLTKKIFNEMIWLLSNIALTNIKELHIPLENEVHLAIRTIEENLDKIENRLVLDVKEKIPIFKEISSQLLEMTDIMKKYYEINIDVVSASETEDKATLPKEDQYLGKILTEENYELEILVQTHTSQPNTMPIINLKSTEDPQNFSNNLQTLNSEIWSSNENDTSDGKEDILQSVQPIIDRLIEEATNKIILLRLLNISNIDLEKDAIKENDINQSITQDFKHEQINDTLFHEPKIKSDDDNEEILGENYSQKCINEMDMEHLSDVQNLVDNLQSISKPIKNLEHNYEEQASTSKEIESIDTILKGDNKEFELKLCTIKELIPDLCRQNESENISNLQLNIETSAIKIDDIHVVIEHQSELDVSITEDKGDMVLASDVNISTYKSDQENIKINDIISKNLSQKDKPELDGKVESEFTIDSAQISNVINDVNLITHKNEVKEYVKDNDTYLENNEIITKDLSQEDLPEKDYKVVLKSIEYSDQTSNILEQEIKSQLIPDEISKHGEELNKNITVSVENNENDNYESQSPSMEFNKNHEITSSTVEVSIEEEVKTMESIQNENYCKSHKHSENELHSVDMQPNSNKNVDLINTEVVKEADKSNIVIDKYIKNNETLVIKPLTNEEEDTENNYFKNNFKDNISLANEVLVLKSENTIQEIHPSISDKDDNTPDIKEKDDDKVFDKDVPEDTNKNDKHSKLIKKESKLTNYATQCEKLCVTDIQQPQVQVGIYSKEDTDSFEDENQNSSDHENGCLNSVKSLNITQSADIDMQVVNINKELKQLPNNEDEDSKKELGNQESIMIINKSLSEKEIHVNEDQENFNKILDPTENQENDDLISNHAVELNINQNGIYTDSIVENKEKIMDKNTEENFVEMKKTVKDEEDYVQQDNTKTQLFKSLIDASNHKETSKNNDKVEMFSDKNEQQFCVPDNYVNQHVNKKQNIILDEKFIDTQENNIDNNEFSIEKTAILQKNNEFSSEIKLTKTNDNLKKEDNTFSGDLGSRDSNEKDAEHCLQQEEKPEIHQDSVPEQIKLKKNNEGFVNKIKETQEVKYGEDDNKKKIDACTEIKEAENEIVTDTLSYVVTENTDQNSIMEIKEDVISEKNEINKKGHKNKPDLTEKKMEHILSEGINKDADSFNVEQNKIQEQNVVVIDKISDELFIKSAEDINGSKCSAELKKLDIKGLKSEIKETEKIISNEKDAEHFLQPEEKLEILESEIHQDSVPEQIKLKKNNEGFVNIIKETQEVGVKYGEDDNKEKIDSCTEIKEAENEIVTDTLSYVVTENTDENAIMEINGDIISEKNEINKKDHKNKPALTDKKTEHVLSEGINKDADSFNVEQNKIQEQNVVVIDKISDELFIKSAEDINGSKCSAELKKLDIKGLKSEIKETEKIISNEKDAEHYLQQEEKPEILESEIHQDSVPEQIKLKKNNEGFVNNIIETQEVEVKYGEDDNKEKIDSCTEIKEAENEIVTDTLSYVVTDNTDENTIMEIKGDIISEKNERNKKGHKNKPDLTEKKTERFLSEGINKDADSFNVEQNKIQEQNVVVIDKISDELFIKSAEDMNESKCFAELKKLDIKGLKSEVKETEKIIGMENIKIPFSDKQNQFDKPSFDLENNQNTNIMKEKPQFINPNVADTNMGFSGPPLYIPKFYDSDHLNAPEINYYKSTSNVFYKAESLVREHQIRSHTDMSDTNIAEKYSQAEIKQKAKAMSETRSFYSDKRVSSIRDLKRKPVFSTNLTNRTAVEGSRVKLTCSVLSSSVPVLKWFKNGILLEDKHKYKIKFVDGLITMELLNALPSDSGDYSCTVENEHGFVTTSAKLKVYPSFEASPIPPTFTRSIRDIYHRAENELVLECRIRGQPLPTITWLKNSMPISSDNRYETSYLADGLCRLTIACPTIEDSGSYTCRAESSMWSDQITHVVNFTGFEHHIGPHLSSIERLRSLHDTHRPHFTNVLNDYKVVKGGTIGLQVEIGGAPTRVEWLRGGSSVTEIDKNAQIFVDHGIYTLALSDVTEKHSGLYTCRAWSTHGNVDMNADITVVQPNEMEGKPPVFISRPPKDILISVGEDINISFRVQGEPRPKVFFMKGIRDITNSQRVCKMTSDDYVKFTLKRSVISDAGTYCILARNVFGCDRTFVTVVVRQRASSENLVSDWIYPNDDSTIIAADRNYKTVPGRIPAEPSAVDGGNNWVTLAWPKPDPHAVAPILAYRVDSWLLGKDGGARWIEMGITPRNTFDAFNLKQGEEYHFRVTPRNRYGWGEPVQTSSPIGVGIAGDRPEFIDILPGLLKVLVGETANLSCSFKGKPTPEIVWMKNGHEIEEISRIKTLQLGNVCSLKINDVEIEDEGRYSCEATNVHGRASTYARMTVITDKQIWEADAKLKRERSADATGDYPPQFTMRLRDRRVQATYPVRLTCQVIGSPAPSMTWFKDGQEIIFDRRKVQYQDEHFHTIEIAPTALDDGGVYEALARNNSGAVSCRCCLVVDKGIRAYVAPEFCCGLEPLYRLNEGEELRVSAIVEAYPSVGVTWYRDGVRLRPSRRAIMTLNRDGQIELALASVTTRDAGVYTCTASNEVGQASTSGKVEILTETPREDRRPLPTVICPNVPYSKEPMFIKKPRSTEAQEGDTVIIECEVIGDPTPDVYWLRDFLKPDYYRDANHFKQMAAGPLYRFEIPHAKLDFTGAYSVVARNVHGEAKAIISLQIFAKDLRSNDETHNIRYGRVEVIPRFEKDLTDLLCYDGDAIEFECRVSGNPEPDIRWFHYNEVLPDCPDFESTYEEGTVRLKIKQVAAEDEGTYTCEASNNLGKATSKACLVVYPPGEPNTLSQRLQRPPALASASSTPRSTPRATPARSTSRTPAPRSGSVAHRLRSPTRQIAPKFYTYPFNKVVEEGDSVVLQCAVGGLPTPWATWDKDGMIITPTSRISIKEKDEMLRILQIDEVTTDDVGLYRITLENDFGRAEASARVEVISHKGKFYSRSSSASPGRVAYRRRTPSLTRQD